MDEFETISISKMLRLSIDFLAEIISIILAGLKKYWKITLVLFLFLALFVFWKYRTIRPYYMAKVGYTFNYGHKKAFGDKLFYMDKLIEKKQYELISTTLGLDISIVESIKKIKAKNIVLRPLHEDLTSARVPFYVFFELTNVDNLIGIEKSLTQYLNLDSVMQIYIDRKRAELHRQISFLEQEINFIDSTRNKKELDIPLIALMRLKKEYMENKIQLEKKVNLTKAVTIFESLKPEKVTSSFQLYQITLSYVVYYILTTLLLTSFLYWYRNFDNED